MEVVCSLRDYFTTLLFHLHFHFRYVGTFGGGPCSVLQNVPASSIRGCFVKNSTGKFKALVLELEY